MRACGKEQTYADAESYREQKAFEPGGAGRELPCHEEGAAYHTGHRACVISHLVVDFWGGDANPVAEAGTVWYA